MGEMADMEFENAIASGEIFQDPDHYYPARWGSLAQAVSRRIKRTDMPKLNDGTFFMLFADPGVLAEHPKHDGCYTIQPHSDTWPPRTIWFDEAKCDRVAAELAHKLGRRIFKLQVVNSCVAPPPETPPVQWAIDPKDFRALTDNEEV